MDDPMGALAALEGIEAGGLNRQWLAVVEWIRGRQLYGLGEAEAAYEHAESSLSLAAPTFRSVAKELRLACLIAMGRSPEALDQLPAALEAAETAGIDRYIATSHSLAATWVACAGDPTGARTYLTRARRAAAPDDPLVQAILIGADAACSIAEGDEDRAADLAGEVLSADVLPETADLVVNSAGWAVYVLLPEWRERLDEKPRPSPRSS
jgi:hypothetical protein